MKILILHPNRRQPTVEELTTYLSTWYAYYIKYSEEEKELEEHFDAEGINFEKIGEGFGFLLYQVVGAESTHFGTITFTGLEDHDLDCLAGMHRSLKEFETEAKYESCSGDPINYNLETEDNVKVILYGWQGTEAQFRILLKHLAPMFNHTLSLQ